MTWTATTHRDLRELPDGYGRWGRHHHLGHCGAGPRPSASSRLASVDFPDPGHLADIATPGHSECPPHGRLGMRVLLRSWL